MERQRRKKTRGRKRRIRRILQRITILFRLVVLCLLVAVMGVLFSKRDIFQRNGKTAVDLPEETGRIVKEFESFASISGQEEIDKILKNTTDYPQNMRDALEKNSELLEFVQGYPNHVEMARNLTKEEKEQKFPLFLQWDARWGYDSYGDDVIGLSGCAPTCLAMVIFSLTRDDAVTPDVIADFSTRGNYYSYGTGTKWSLLKEAVQTYGITAAELSLDENVMKNHLDSGEMIICSMRAGDFTDGGHFIVIYGYDGTGFLVNDPNSRVRSAKSWSYERLSRQIKNLWCYRIGDSE